MSFFRVTTSAAPVSIGDLGITIPSSTTVVLSDQFSINDLYLSADLESSIISGELAVQIDYGTGFASVLAADYTNRDALAAFLNVYELTNENANEKLVSGAEVNAAGPSAAPLHVHDARYYTETEVSSTGGAALTGFNQTGLTYALGVTVQAAIAALDAALAGFDLDDVYDTDADGILNVDGASKNLDFRSDNINDIKVTRTNGTDVQEALLLDVSANELLLGALVSGALAPIDVRVKRDFIIDGNLTVTGTTTDTTVDEMNVTNANIRLRSGATGPGADAWLFVERGSTGTDAAFKWNETTDRWQAGLEGTEQTIALLEANETVSGSWLFQGPGTTAPNLLLTDKASAPSTGLGSAGQIPLEMINNELHVYDKTRAKHLGVARLPYIFTGRDNANNANEYARIGEFTSNQSSVRLHRNMTLVAITVQTSGNKTWTARVRKNGVATNLASLAVSAASGGKDTTLNVDFNADDKIEVYIEGTSVDRPLIQLVFAPRA